MMIKQPNFLVGALWGFIFALPLIAVMYLGFIVAGFSFLPYDLFAYTVVVLPPVLLNFGKDTMINILLALNLGRLDQVAKPAENLLGLAMLPAFGAVSGAIFFFARNRLPNPKLSPIPGILLGIVFGLPLSFMATTVPQTGTAAPISTLLWNMVLFILWGVSVNAVYQALAFRASATQASTVTVQGTDRRSFLITMGGAAAAITVIGAGVGALLNRRDLDTTTAGLPESTPLPEGSLPNSGDAVAIVPGSRPEVTPLRDHYRIDIASIPPVIQEEGYTLPFTSVLGSPDGSKQTLTTLTLDDIRGLEPVSEYLTMGCISNRVAGDLISTILWTGARMQDVLAQVEIPEGATHLKITCQDGFDETVALDLINNDPRTMLAYAWEDQPLTVEHGFPLRIHLPDLYGMKQPKWITEMEFLDADEDGFWVRRGWDKDARVRSTAVIDTVAVDDMFERDGQTFVPVGGISWAGARGISGVEVRVDGGEWAAADLRSPINDRTWNFWRYEYPFVEGAHTFEVRCIEGDGTAQIETVAPVQPSGATGYHRENATLRQQASA